MHRLIFSGQVQPGHDPGEVKARLGQLLRINDPVKLDMLFSGKAITLKRNMAPEEARRYEAAIVKAGAMVTIDPPLADQVDTDDLAAATVHGKSLNMDTVVGSTREELEQREQEFDTPAEEVMAETRNQAASLAINTSGAGKGTAVPKEARGLSWGGFLLNWIWGLFNGTYIALLALIPLVNIFVAFWLLFKGREMAWQNKRWESVEHFNRVQRNWGIAGLVLLLLMLAYYASVFMAMMSAKDQMEQALGDDSAFEQALGEVDDPEMQQAMRDLRAALEEARQEAERLDALEAEQQDSSQ